MSENAGGIPRIKTKVDGNIFISKEKTQFVTAHGASVCGNDCKPFRAGSRRFRPVYQRFNTNSGSLTICFCSRKQYAITSEKHRAKPDLMITTPLPDPPKCHSINKKKCGTIENVLPLNKRIKNPD